VVYLWARESELPGGFDARLDVMDDPGRHRHRNAARRFALAVKCE
jgi:hypothetical protein